MTTAPVPRTSRSPWLRILSLPQIALFLLGLLAAQPAFSDKSSAPEPFTIDVPNAEADVLLAVQTVVDDHIIRGTYVYEREKILNEAAAETSSSFFGTWSGAGHVYYKVRRDALAPRNFKNSSDIGVITVRYVVQQSSPMKTHLEITAVFVEDGTRRVHPSNSSVETAEFSEIQDQLRKLLSDRQRADELQLKKRQEADQAAQASALAKQTTEEAGLYQAAESSLKSLERRADELQHALEVRIPNADTELKAAPFHSAATLSKLPANSDVLVEIVTTYWYGVETPDGRRGWVKRDQAVALP